MIINQSNLHGLTTGYSAAFNKALSEVSPDYKHCRKRLRMARTDPRNEGVDRRQRSPAHQ